MLEQDYSESPSACSLSLFNNILALHNPSHRLSSFGRDFGKGKSISHFNKLSKMLSGYMGVATSIDGTRLKDNGCDLFHICLESLLHLPTEIVQERNGNSSFVVLHWAATGSVTSIPL